MSRLFSIVALSVASVAAAGASFADVITIPNYSFENPTVPNAYPYASPLIDSWNKSADPTLTYSSGIFLNTSPYVTGADQNQLGFLFSATNNELYQDLPATFQAGQSYSLAMKVMGGGGMTLGATMEIRLYYRDPTIPTGDNRKTIASGIYANDNSGAITFLESVTANLPSVKPTDPWAGAAIGVQLFSTSNAGGYYDMDNVVLTSATPEPSTLSFIGVGAAGLLARRRRGSMRQN